MSLVSLAIKDMQIKTVRFHFTVIRVTVIKKTEASNAGEDVGKEEPLLTVGRNRCRGPQQPKNRTTIWPSYTRLVYVPKGLVINEPQIIHVHAHCWDSHNSQDMESVLISFSRRMYNENMINIHSGMTFCCGE